MPLYLAAIVGESGGLCKTSCGYGNFDDDSTKTCVSCPVEEGCLTCTALDTCTLCDTGFQLISDACVRCEPGCLECEDGACTTCDFQLYLNAENQCVTECGPGKFINYDTLSCAVCPQDIGVVNCESLHKHASCEEGYFLNYRDQCEVCADGCVQCNADACTKCADGLFMDGTGECVEACGERTFVKVTTHLSMCKPCLEGCSECDSVTECTAVDRGYHIVSGIPVQCAPKCLHCTADECLECLDNLFISADGICVNHCGPAKYSDEESRCQECHTGCEQCSESETCERCEGGYELSTEDVCEECTDPNCATCERGICMRCKEDFY